MSIEALVEKAVALDKQQVMLSDRAQFRIDPTSIASIDGHNPRNGAFAQLVQQPPKVEQLPQSSLPNPMQEAQRQGGRLRVEDARQLGAVLERFQQSQQGRWNDMMSRVKNNPNSALSPSATKQLEMKMDTINRQFGRLNQSLNLPGQPNAQSPFVESLGITTEELSKPLKTFFNFIARGERQLYGLQTDIDGIYAKGDQTINPAVLLKLQLKMTHVSQQLELFTSMLNKSLESSKTVFNTQI